MIWVIYKGAKVLKDSMWKIMWFESYEPWGSKMLCNESINSIGKRNKKCIMYHEVVIWNNDMRMTCVCKRHWEDIDSMIGFQVYILNIKL